MRHLETFRLIEAVARAGSIRKAAEDAGLTASALNRRIARFEDEFGARIFERLARGVRLNPAGELVLQHYRGQRSDLARVRSQVADLSGVRRGHVTVACSQALLPYFLPAEIARYRREHPGVTFAVNVRDRARAEEELAAFRSDLALVFEPAFMVDFEVLHQIAQPVCAVLAADHPLAARPTLRLRECLDIPHVSPSEQFGVRYLLDRAAHRSGRRVQPIVETESFELIRHYVLHEGVVGFQIPIGLDPRAGRGLVVRPIADQDVPPGHLLLGQLKGRVLPVATARFVARLALALDAVAAADPRGAAG
ncbi:LysR family transcriptional regulator [Salinarimonas ramus]|uniref:LysR family transcriptional regulator n=1 Tax=Salinarimonas ramus TaxID=690164 RepID=A0A917Q6T2_9HYPH|nr:LysR family transcriptional regulator [Salinarimonas ramus]GGK31868.1 LysR family transcriptional regulator [Salinarimonas ramus]